MAAVSGFPRQAVNRCFVRQSLRVCRSSSLQVASRWELSGCFGAQLPILHPDLFLLLPPTSTSASFLQMNECQLHKKKKKRIPSTRRFGKTPRLSRFRRLFAKSTAPHTLVRAMQSRSQGFWGFGGMFVCVSLDVSLSLSTYMTSDA